ncbi:hypothetical protein Tco_0335540 [Tanacetum coccineum]
MSVIQVKIWIERAILMYSIGNMRDARNRMEEIDKLVGPRNLIYQLSLEFVRKWNTQVGEKFYVVRPEIPYKGCFENCLSSPIMLLIGDNLTLWTPDYAVDEAAEDKGNAPALTARIV